MHDYGCAKPVIKMLKLFIDANGNHDFVPIKDHPTVMEGIFSHAIKTLVLHLMKVQGLEWYNSYEVAAQRFLDALLLLARYCEVGRLCSYFVPAENLLEAMSWGDLRRKSLWLRRQIIPRLRNSLHYSEEECKEVWTEIFV